MAKGRKGGIKSLAETVDESEIVDLGEEVNPPNILIDNDYGVSGKVGDYALVKKKICHRTGKAEDNEYEGKVIRYVSWEDVNYNSTIFGVFRNYLNVVSLSEIKKLNKCTEWQKIADIYNEILLTIRKCVNSTELPNSLKYNCDNYDNIQKLLTELNKVQDTLDKADELMALIKEKRRIIVDNTEPKKHRLKESEM